MRSNQGSGVHRIVTTVPLTGSGGLGDAHIKPRTSPSVAASGAHWEIDWQDANGHLVRATDGDRPNSAENAETLVGSPRVAALSTGVFIHVDAQFGDLFVNGAGVGQAVDQGNSPAIAADGSGGWRIVFVGQDLHLHYLDSSNHTRTYSTVFAAGDASPSIVGMFD
ncbi:MAG: hypothetical protein HOW97_19575 [Catenulispora sp.]|nr:hypothetical protein [Catenulispora sp.]